MSRISVSQFITDDGKIQIDVTNTSGRALSLTRDQISSADKADGRSNVPDYDEPCSLIVSLRASHPQLFFYRGLQSKPVTSTSVVSPLRLLNEGGFDGAGEGGYHRRSGSALWGREAVDPAILQVSQRTWREHNFLPIAPDTGGTLASGGAHRGSTGSHSRSAGRADAAPLSPPPDSLAASFNSDDRPLLVREEMADYVLLPGERRTLFIEVSSPSVLSRLLAPRKQRPAAATATSTIGDVWLHPSQPSSQQEESYGEKEASNENSALGRQQQQPPLATHAEKGSGDENDDSNSNAPFREITDVFPMNHSTSAFSAPSSSVGAGAPQRGDFHQGEAKDRNAVQQSSGSIVSDRASVTPIGVDRTSVGDARGTWRSGAGAWDVDATETDEYGRSPSRQPLSIVCDSSTTRNSVQTSSQQQQQHPHQQQGSRVPDSQRSSRDYVVPPTSSSNSNSNSVSFLHPDPRDSEKRERKGFRDRTGDSPAPSKADGAEASSHQSYDQRQSKDKVHYCHPSLSQRPVFYVYYHPLGDENRCVDRARKWIAKEQHTYHEWRENFVRTIAAYERKRERVWTVTEEQMVVPPQPRQEVKRILPPSLGELVRWRDDDGSGGGDTNNPMEPSPITVAAFHYYFTRLPNGSSGSYSNFSMPSTGPLRRSNSVVSRHGIPEVPLSFAATRTNRVSKKAKKMFMGSRQGAGTVVLPLRIPAPPEQRSGAGHGQKRNAGSTPHQTSSSAKGMPRPPPLQPPSSLQQPHQQQQQVGRSQLSHALESSVNATPMPPDLVPSNTFVQPPRIDGDDLPEIFSGSVTQSEEAATHESSSGAYASRPRLRSGRGLALLDDSVTGSFAPSAYCTEAAQSSNDYPTNASTLADAKRSLLRAPASASRWGRTETLDPETAELAACHPVAHRGSTVYSPLGGRSELPSFPSSLDHTLESSRCDGSTLGERAGAGTSAELLDPLSATRRLTHNDSSSHLNTLQPEEVASALDGDGAAAAEAEPKNSGSFVAQLFQSFRGLLDSSSNKVDNASNLDCEGTSPHARDISSAPPQRLTYRHRNSVGGIMNTSLSSSVFGKSSMCFTPNQQQQQLNRLRCQTSSMKEQMRVLAKNLASMAAAAAEQLADFLQQHGPAAVEGVTMTLNFLKDTVFTPDNVKMMETVITPMVVVFSAVVLLYLFVFCGDGAGEALPLLYSESL